MSLEKNPTTGLVLDFFGPTLEFLVAPDDERSDFCVLKGTIAPGVSVPLHSHADAEGFFVISGSVEGLRHDTNGYTWITAQPGDYLHVPGGARHAWRHNSGEPVVNLIITTKKLARFFLEAGRPAMGAPRPVTPEELDRFTAISARYGYWNATPEENAAVGIHVSLNPAGAHEQTAEPGAARDDRGHVGSSGV
jgi:quercetin dioxygenase-like cupin family protein